MEKIQELLGGGAAQMVVCDQCPELVETIFGRSLCQTCYAAHRKTLDDRAELEQREAGELWKTRISKPKEDRTADREFILAIRRLSPGPGTGRSFSPSSMEWESAQLLRSWRESAPPKPKKAGPSR